MLLVTGRSLRPVQGTSRRRRESAFLYYPSSSTFSRDEDDPAGLSHCTQPDVRCYAQGVQRLV
jgi:hypothetical protein